MKIQYFCPLGKHTVDFVDETQFSSVAMYLKGRIWLEEKTKVRPGRALGFLQLLFCRYDRFTVSIVPSSLYVPV